MVLLKSALKKQLQMAQPDRLFKLPSSKHLYNEKKQISKYKIFQKLSLLSFLKNILDCYRAVSRHTRQFTD